MGRKAVDLLNKQFGYLTVIEKYGSKPNDKHVYWKCLCKCGNETLVRGSHLTAKNKPTISCGCQIGSKLNLVGQQFGKLTVIEEGERSKTGRVRWICKCSCGSEVIVQANHLTDGSIQSCGCTLSRGEDKIANFLIKNNIIFKRQYYKDNWYLSSGHHPRFDFAIFKDDKLLGVIEYNGSQHYTYRTNINTWNTKEQMEQTQQYDKEKQNICLKEHLPFLIIPYTDFNKIEDKVKEFIQEL